MDTTGVADSDVSAATGLDIIDDGRAVAQPKRIDDLVDHAPDLVGRGDVALDHHRTATRVFDFAVYFVRLLRAAAIVDGHLRPRLREPPATGAADAFRAAGHQRDAALQFLSAHLNRSARGMPVR